MFSALRIHGTAGTILWGYQEAARLSSWSIVRNPAASPDRRWEFSATATWMDEFRLRQTPLLFTAPRPKGRWCWPINTETLQRRPGGVFVASLGLPQQ